MSKARLLFISAVAALSVIALSASTASAKISFEWFVNGTLLAAGQQQTFNTNTDGKTFDLHGTVAGIAVLLLSNKLTTSGGLLFGGRPGTSEETLIFENVTVDPPLSGCTAETGGIPNPVPGVVATAALKNEIVEGQNGEVLIRYVPKAAGGAFTTIKFLGASCAANGVEGEVTGGILGLPLPQRTSVLRQNLVFPSIEQLFLLASGGGRESTSLSFGGNQATLTGLTLIVLNSDAAWGPF